MPGFDKMGAYQTVDSTDREDESNSQCQSLDDTNNVKGMFLQNYYFQVFFIYLVLANKCHYLFFYYKYLKLYRFTFFLFLLCSHGL